MNICIVGIPIIVGCTAVAVVVVCVVVYVVVVVAVYYCAASSCDDVVVINVVGRCGIVVDVVVYTCTFAVRY